jgi:propionyl-CoA carboxylase alpha chain
MIEVSENLIICEIDGTILNAAITKFGESISINSGQGDLILRILPTFNDPNEVVTEGSLTAPMPGKIIKINAKLNKSVKAGETLLILEAMKMEHAVKAVSDGKISEMYVKTGDQVESGANLLKID